MKAGVRLWVCEGCRMAVHSRGKPARSCRCPTAPQWRPASTKGRRHKFNVASPERRTWRGMVFDSMREMRRYQELFALQEAGQIRNLKRQRWCVLIPGVRWNGRTLRSIRYRIDMEYDTVGRIPSHIVEDVKGVRTHAYVIKRQLFLRQHPEFGFREVE